MTIQVDFIMNYLPSYNLIATDLKLDDRCFVFSDYCSLDSTYCYHFQNFESLQYDEITVIQ